MTFIKWSNSLSVGVPSLDAQHQQLVNTVNQLFAALSEGKGNDVLDEIFTSLVRYTAGHFATEERLLKEHGYPDLPAHLKEHEKLNQQVKDFIAQKKAGKTMLSVKLVNFLKSWLVNHIQGTDQKYGSFLQSKGVR